VIGLVLLAPIKLRPSVSLRGMAWGQREGKGGGPEDWRRGRQGRGL